MMFGVAWVLLGGVVHADPINALLGDASWPGASERTDEVARIRTHLRYVADRLRARDVSALTEAARANRRASLAALDGYITRGEFPRRTADRFAGRRPRFIDDRGVHCAVAYLIAASGAERLAREIGATYEYAYVSEMRSPALARWAAGHGFTIEELGSIQPTYHQPVSPDRARIAIERARDLPTLECARRAPAERTVALHVHGDEDGDFKVTTPSTHAFARCVAARLSDHRKPRSVSSYRPYDFDFELSLDSPNAMLEALLARPDFVPPRCTPRPGDLVREVTLDVTVGQAAPVVAVTTTPPNAEVRTCIESEVARMLVPTYGPGVWRLHARRTVPIRPRFSDKRLASALHDIAPIKASTCEVARSRRITLSVAGALGATSLQIDVKGGDDALNTCIRDRVERYLWQAFGGLRQVGTRSEAYFRVDAAVQATVTFEVKPPR